MGPTLRKFIKLEYSSGVVLFITTILALILDNTPWYTYYEALFNLPLGIQLGPLQLFKPLLLWIDDGLMTIFFLLAGLEIKREMLEGELNNLAKASLPVIAGLGGMFIPALIYFAFNVVGGSTSSLQGWAIPIATDVAFSLGILSLLGNKLPVGLKVFLTALAIFDDISAVFIIAVFYTHHISLIFLLSAGLFLGLLILLNRLRVTTIAVYILIGVALWFCVLKSGIHATLSGIALAFTIPIRDWRNPRVSPLRSLEHTLYPWVAFVVLPIFAFANAGISFAQIRLLENLFNPITLGIALGLFLGKQIGIWSTCWILIKIGWAHMPYGGNWRSLYGISLLAGMGFTMSLFIGALAFGNIEQQHYSTMVRLGIIIGSFLSGISGYLILNFTL